MTSEDEVPPGLRRLWGLSATSRLGRPAELDVERVVRTAVQLADRDGLAGVTLPKVAKELGYTSMSLYRYVGSKDELLGLMSNAALGDPPAMEGLSWREGLRRWALAQWELYLRRPWLARVPVTGPPSGPSEIAWMDAALTALRDTGLDWAAKVGVLSLLGGYIRHSALLSQDLAAGRAEDEDQAAAERAYGRALVNLVDPARFPEAAKLFQSTVFEGLSTVDAAEPDPDFTFGLDLILDGIAHTIDQTH